MDESTILFILNHMKKTNSIRVSYASAVYGAAEKAAVNRILTHPSKIVIGPSVKAFEQKIAKIFGKKFGVMVNSGSSANLLAAELSGLPRGSEVVTPLLTFGTTLAPILQKGLVPVFADVDPATYVINADHVEALVNKKTKALMIPLLIGNIPDMAKLREIAHAHNLLFIEDSCDTLGGKFDGKPTGYFSDISTTSFYASHIITAAGGGGMICLNDRDWAARGRVMSNWGRASSLFGSYEKSEELKKRFAGTLAGDSYDAKFIFSEMGYNFQPLELQGAFGLAQLRRLPRFQKMRRSFFEELKKFFSSYEHFFMLPKEHARAHAHWLAFPLTVREDAPFSRNQITRYLEEQNIQTRPIFGGNILYHPAFRAVRHRAMKQGYPVTDSVMRRSFLIGCHHGLTRGHLDHVKDVFVRFLARRV